MRLCREWEIYADDCTIRTGRIVDGTYYSDAEYAERIKTAVKAKEEPMQELEAAFEALGFNTKGLGAEKTDRLQPKAKAKPEAKAKTEPKLPRKTTVSEKASKGLGRAAESSDPSPRAHIRVPRRRNCSLWLQVLIVGFFGGSASDTAETAPLLLALPPLPPAVVVICHLPFVMPVLICVLQSRL